MKTMSSISNHIYFEKNCFYSDFEIRYNFEKSLTFGKVFKAIYKDLQVAYPKYFKMDYLSKLGFLATEVLLQNKVLTEQYSSDKIGIILGNSASTYLMDEKHQLSLEDKNAYYPSPANFVYTLPNIMTGEICIKHKFKGENAVFIMEYFDADFIAAYCYKLFIDNKIDACVIGYVNIDKENYEAFLILVEKKDSKQIFNAKTLEEIYKKYKIETHG